MTKRFLQQLPLLCALLATVGLPACHDDDNHDNTPPIFTLLAIPEVEPNDTPATATALPAGVAGAGSLATAGDLDIWSFAAAAGSIVQVELCAVRTDQASWNTADNVPRLSLVASDGTTVLLVHDYSGAIVGAGNSWDWGKHDLDFEAFLIPSTGTYFLNVTQDNTAVAGGNYTIEVRTIGFGPLQTEAEPPMTIGVNDTAATAQPITPGTIHGWHVDNESDYYSFTVTAPSIVYFELRSYRNGVASGDNDYFDTELNLWDTNGTTNLENDDDTFFYDSGISYFLVTPGTYFIEVLECCGQGDAPYFLTFNLTLAGASAETESNDTTATANNIAYGSIVTGAMAPTDTDFFAFAGTAGDMVRVWGFDGGDYQGSNSSMTMDVIAPDGTTVLPFDGPGGLRVRRTILQATGTFFVRVTSSATDAYGFRLERFAAAAYEVEPNDALAAANGLDANGNAAGVIATAGDIDLFHFNAVAGQLVHVVLHAESADGSNGYFDLSGHGSSLEPELRIRDAAGIALATSVYSATDCYAEGVVDGLPTIAVCFVAPATSTYYADVQAESQDFGPDRTYVLSVR